MLFCSERMTYGANIEWWGREKKEVTASDNYQNNNEATEEHG